MVWVCPQIASIDELTVERKRCHVLPRKTWNEYVRKDRKDRRDLLDVDPEDRPVWRSAVYASGLLPTPTRKINAAG